MRLVNPNYVATAPASITPARWIAIQTQISAYFTAHPEIANVDVAALQTLFPELQNPDVFEQLRRAMGLSIVS